MPETVTYLVYAGDLDLIFYIEKLQNLSLRIIICYFLRHSQENARNLTLAKIWIYKFQRFWGFNTKTKLQIYFQIIDFENLPRSSCCP